MTPLLTAHSYYSFGQGVASIQELCANAAKAGYRSVALTDINGVYGLVWFLQACQEYHLQPIIGAEIRCNDQRAVALVYNRHGYTNLCSIISDRHLNQEFSLVESIVRHRNGLTVLSDSFPLLEQLNHMCGADNLHVEMRPNSNLSAALRFSKTSGIPLAASLDVFFLRPEDFVLHKLLAAIHCNSTLSRLKAEHLASPHAWLKIPQIAMQEFQGYETALENSAQIEALCTSFQLQLGALIFPGYEKTNDKPSTEVLHELCYQGAMMRYGEINDVVQERLEYELSIITSKGFTDYFLIVREIVQRSPRTCGRGSVAASIVSYCLGITDVDPIKHNLYFERFLNPGRIDPPDADIDFAWDERDDIFDWIFQEFGNDRAAMISNHVTLKTRAAVREVAKVYGLPDGEIARVTKRLAGWGGERISEIVKKHPTYKHEDFPEPWPEIFAYAERLQGTPRHLSVHSGGVVIALEGLNNHVPRQPSAKGVQVIQFEKDQAEDYGLVKIDVLGNRSLAVVRDALQELRKRHGLEIQYQTWNPIDNLETQRLIKESKAMGCFYIESPAMRLLFRKAQRGDFETLIALSSLIRPAANKYINMYVDRLQGKPYQPLHPLLADVLHETFGVMVYQEDVSKTAVALAGFSVIEGDQLRKVLTKKHAHKRLADFREKFFSGCRQRGVGEETIQKIWEMILSFSGYSFCKPHSASYAMLSFKCAWLKAHYPAAFMAAVISNQGGYYSTQAYLSECRRLDLKILQPDINESEWKYIGDQDWVRVGLKQLKGVHEEALKTVLTEREKNGRFTSFADFLKRISLTFSDMRVMIKAGLFDAVEPDISRPGLMWLYRYWSGSQTLTHDWQLYQAQVEKAKLVKPYSSGVALQHEFDSLGVMISRSPLELFANKIKSISRIKASELSRHVGKIVQVVGWLVTSKMVQTINDQAMEFVSFEDETAIFETVFFPPAYRRFCHLLVHYDRPYVLRGSVQNDRGAVTLNVLNVRLIPTSSSRENGPSNS